MPKEKSYQRRQQTKARQREPFSNEDHREGGYHHHAVGEQRECTYLGQSKGVTKQPKYTKQGKTDGEEAQEIANRQREGEPLHLFRIVQNETIAFCFVFLPFCFFFLGFTELFQAALLVLRCFLGRLHRRTGRRSCRTIACRLQSRAILHCCFQLQKGIVFTFFLTHRRSPPPRKTPSAKVLSPADRER